MLAFAIPAMFTAVSFFFLKLSDRFFLLHYQGKAEVGLYTVANSLAQPLYIVGMAFRMAWPQWHYAKLNEPELHKRMVSRSSTYFMAFNALLLVLIGVYLPVVVHVLLARTSGRSARRPSCSRCRWPSTTCTSSSGSAPTSPRRTA